jgi:DNA-binding transcriptional MerR regulator
MTQQLYLTGDVSRMLGVRAHRIAYLFVTRKLTEPQLRLGNRRVFSRSDVQRVAKALGRPIDEQEDQ